MNRAAMKGLGASFSVLFLLVFLAGSTQLASASVVVTWVDEERGIAGGYSSLHDHLLPPGADHGGGQTEAAHFAFLQNAPPVGQTQVDWFLHDHGGADALSADQSARIRDAADVWSNSGADVLLNEVFSDAADQVHVHGDSTSGCGGGAIGCAELSWFLAHSGDYGDGHPLHHMVDNTDGFGELQVLTMLTRGDWYAGADSGLILGSQLDYMTVAIQEFGHHLGLAHPNESGGHLAGEVDLSPMNGSLPSGVTRRILQPGDSTHIDHLYGTMPQGVPEPGTVFLLATGLLGMFGYGRYRKGR